MANTFLQDETGLDTGNPIELFRFYGVLGSYTYTSGNRPMNFEAPSATASELYVPKPLQRSEIVLGDVTEKNELNISLPKGVSLADDYVFNISPTDVLNLEIYRQNGATGAWQVIFYGVVTSFSVQENQVKLTCPSVFTNYLQTEYPNVYYQSNCNHSLYDARCGLDKTKFQVNAKILTVDATKETFTYELTDAGPAGNGVAAEIDSGQNGVYLGTAYNYSDTDEWTQYLFDYPDLQATANRLVNTGVFKSVAAYAAWHYASTGKNEGRIVHPTAGATPTGGILSDGWLNAGIIIDGHEQRLVISQVGTTIVMNFPMRNIAVGDIIVMFPGCLHTSQDCINKFNNGKNFLGFEYIPYVNPFQLGVGVQG